MLILEMRKTNGVKVQVNWPLVRWYARLDGTHVEVEFIDGKCVAFAESDSSMRSMLARGGAKFIKGKGPKFPKKCPDCKNDYGKCPNCGAKAVCMCCDFKCRACGYQASGFDEFDRAQVT